MVGLGLVKGSWTSLTLAPLEHYPRSDPGHRSSKTLGRSTPGSYVEKLLDELRKGFLMEHLRSWNLMVAETTSFIPQMCNTRGWLPWKLPESFTLGFFPEMHPEVEANEDAAIYALAGLATGLPKLLYYSDQLFSHASHRKKSDTGNNFFSIIGDFRELF